MKFALLALALLAATARTAASAEWKEPPPRNDVPSAITSDAPLIEDQYATESEQAKRLWRARAEHELRRAEAARRLEAQQARDREINRSSSAASDSGRRESFLHHEVYRTRREFDSISRDPADLSAVARRGNAERELNYLRNELDVTAPAREAATRRLDGLRLR